MGEVFLISPAVWLLGGALAWFTFRCAGRESDMGRILNVCGIASLVSGTAIVIFDLCVRAAGWDMPRELWGGLHLVLDFWFCAIVIIGLSRLPGISRRLAALAVVLQFAVSVPIAMLFMRAQHRRGRAV